MAGIRIGTLYTENKDLVEALAQLGSFHGVSGTTQHQIAQLLQDRGMDQSFTRGSENTLQYLRQSYYKDDWENNPHISPVCVFTQVKIYTGTISGSATEQGVCINT